MLGKTQKEKPHDTHARINSNSSILEIKFDSLHYDVVDGDVYQLYEKSQKSKNCQSKNCHECCNLILYTKRQSYKWCITISGNKCVKTEKKNKWRHIGSPVLFGRWQLLKKVMLLFAKVKSGCKSCSTSSIVEVYREAQGKGTRILIFYFPLYDRNFEKLVESTCQYRL